MSVHAGGRGFAGRFRPIGAFTGGGEPVAADPSAISAPVLTQTSTAGEAPFTFDSAFDETIYAGNTFRVQVSTDSGFATITEDISHDIAGGELDSGDIDITADGFTTPDAGVPFWLRARVERDDGINSDWSNVLNDTIAAPASAVSTTHLRSESIDFGYGSGPGVPASAIACEDGDKIVIHFCCAFNGANQITGVTANGGAITFHEIGNSGASGNERSAAWYADTSGVTSLSLSIAVNGSTHIMHIHVAAVRGAAAGAPTASYFNVASITNPDPIDVDGGLAAPSNGAMILMTGATGGDALINYSGATVYSGAHITDGTLLSSFAEQSTAANVTILGAPSGGPGYNPVLIANTTWSPA